MSLTVGQASGVIAFGVVIVQILLPLAIIIVLVSLVQDNHNAATWSVISRCVQSSWWPVLFRADSTSTHHVSRRVTFLSWLITLSLVLLGIASVITPLGLSDSIRPTRTISSTFRYAPDRSAFGFGTPPRYKRFARLCGMTYMTNCPGRFDGVSVYYNSSDDTFTINPTKADAYFNTSIPENLTEIFSSATDGTALSGAFDIQYRAWDIGIDYNHSGDSTIRPKVDHGLPYAKSAYRPLDSLILHNKIEALEGIIVDSENTGIGYRNHSMPQGLPLGGKWIEDITWIEPVTECANTNLTIELAAGNSPFNITNVELIDNGGFIDLAHTLPYPDELKSSQDPNLSVRALQGAYMGNTLLMYHLNVSIPNNTGPRNTFFGRRFSLDFDLDQQIDRIGTSKLRPRFLKFSSEPDQETSSNVSSSSDTKFDFSDYDWTDIEILCKGSGSKRPKVSNVHIMCGYLYGAPRLIDEGDPRIFQPRSKWNQSLYVCASGVRSSIKTVEFSAKGTASLENLNITRVQDKVYQKKGQWPLWAVERTYKPTFDAPPLWGIVAKKHKKAKDLSTIRAKRFWIPATGSSRGIKTSLDSMTSTRAFAAVLDSTYAISTDNDLATAYTGSQNAALKRLWQELSQSPDTASRIINLIYTEILATTTVGTKSAIVSPTQKGSNSLNRVVQNERRLQYDLRYAIPAIAELLIVTLVMIALIVCFLSGFSFEKMSQLLNQTSTGRIVTNLLYPDICEPGAKTKDWAHAAGEIKLRYPFTKHANIEEKKGLHGNESAFNGDGASAGLLKHDTDVHITQTNSSTT